MRQCVCVSMDTPNYRVRFKGSFSDCQDFLMRNRSRFPDMQIYTQESYDAMKKPKRAYK